MANQRRWNTVRCGIVTLFALSALATLSGCEFSICFGDDDDRGAMYAPCDPFWYMQRPTCGR